MPTTNVPVTTISRAGVATGSDASEVAGDTTNDHNMVNTGVEFLSVRNAGVTPRTLTLITPGTIDGQAVGDRAVTIGASATGKLVGPFPTNIYSQLSGDDKHKLKFTVDHADLKLLAFKVLR